MMEVPQSPEELAEITVELLRRDGLREDVYVRPIVYKSSETIGVRLHNLESDITIFGVPFGQYIDTEGGIRAQVSSWRRTDDNAIPARGKITGAYVNGALAKSEAQLNGFDEAIVLTAGGHVSEGSAENLFIVKNGVLITPPVTDNILEGITRRRLLGIARDDLGITTLERSIDRTELYGADEVFLCGTGAQISPVIEIDRRAIGTGRPGPVSRDLSRVYFDAVRGRTPAYRDWLTPVY
jgi:branched-chain amino acid aminotransferase